MSDRPDDSVPAPSATAESAFLEYLDLLDRGKAVDFDGYCAQRPGLAPRLRELRTDWAWMENTRQRLAPETPLGGPEGLDQRLVSLSDRSSGARRYQIIEELARGGMGTVFSVQDHDIRRTLAMKVCHASGRTKPDDPGFPLSRKAIARFLEEAQITGQLEHPGIVPVHELGVDEDGRVFFTMRLVEGRDLSTIFDLARQGRDGWTVPRVVGILVRICETVAYAHSKGIVHRDLKPSNVMVGRFGEAYVVDWGLARLNRPLSTQVEDRPTDPPRRERRVRTDRQDAIDRTPESPLLTMEGAVVGTPAYMSPEQAEGRADQVGPRADIFALGAMLYTLLTGRRPYEVPGETATTREVLEAVRRGPPPPVRTQNPTAPAELEAICEKAMAREPMERYEDASLLAQDLQAYLDNRVVTAYRTGAFIELRKWVARNRMTAGAIFLAVVLSVVGLLALDFVQSRANDSLRVEHAVTELETYVASIGAATAALRLHDVPEARLRLDRAPTELRGWEWHHFRSRLDQSVLSLVGHSEWVRSVAFSPDGSQIVTASSDRTLRIWDAHTGAAIRVLRGHEGDVNSAVFSPDGTKVVSGSSDRTIRVWDVASGETLRTLAVPSGSVTNLALDPSGERVAFASPDSTVHVWRLDSGVEEVRLSGHSLDVLMVAFSPDGRFLASGSQDQSARLWDVAAGTCIRTWPGHAGKVGAVAFSPDGRTLITCDGSLTMRDVATGDTVDRWDAREVGGAGAVTWMPDGRRIAVSGWEDRTLRIWDRESRQIVTTLRGHDEPIVALAVSPDGNRIASACHDGNVKVWDSAIDADIRVLRGHENYVYAIAFDPAGARLASAGKDYGVKLWDVASGEPVASHFVSTDVFGMEFSPDGASLALAMRDHGVRIIDAATGAERLTLRGHEGPVVAVSYAPGGARLASGSLDATVRLWDLGSGREIRTLRGHTGAVRSVAHSPDGSRVASGSDDGTVRIWSAATGDTALVLKGHEGPVQGVAFHPDGRLLASASADRTVRIWDLGSGAAVAVLRGHTRPVTSLAFTPDGARLATGSEDRCILLWDAKSWREVAKLRGHEWWVFAVKFSPDGRRLASASKDRTVRLWETDPLGSLAAHARESRALREEVRPLVERLFSESVLTASVVTRLEADGTLSAERREAALRLARATGDDPRRLDPHTWRRLCSGELPAAEVQTLLWRAKVASGLDTTNPATLRTLGAACYRAGKVEEALAPLQRIETIDVPERSRVLPGALAFRAMALQRLGRTDDARAAFDRLLEVAAAPNFPFDDAFRAVANEARRLIDAGRPAPWDGR